MSVNVSAHQLAADGAPGGTAVAVPDEDLLADLTEFAGREGLVPCPEGAACLTATRRLRSGGWLAGTERVVVLNTGTALKYPQALPG